MDKLLIQACLSDKNIDNIIQNLNEVFSLSRKSNVKCFDLSKKIMNNNIRRLKGSPKNKEQVTKLIEYLNDLCLTQIIDIIKDKYPNLIKKKARQEPPSIYSGETDYANPYSQETITEDYQQNIISRQKDPTSLQEAYERIKKEREELNIDKNGRPPTPNFVICGSKKQKEKQEENEDDYSSILGAPIRDDNHMSFSTPIPKATGIFADD